jgi:CDP-diglyceride synthetase
MKELLHAVFQLLPIILAFVAIYACLVRRRVEQRDSDRRTMIIFVWLSVFLIGAQGYRWYSYFVEANYAGTWAVDIVWTVYKTSVEAAFIYIAMDRRA